MVLEIQTFSLKQCIWKYRLKMSAILSRPQCVLVEHGSTPVAKQAKPDPLRLFYQLTNFEIWIRYVYNEFRQKVWLNLNKNKAHSGLMIISLMNYFRPMKCIKL